MRHSGGAPHALAKFGCIPGNPLATWCGRRLFRYGWRGPSVVRLSVAFAKLAHFFSTGHSDHAGHARQNLSRFEALRIFYDFPGRKPPKHCPDVTQRVFVVGFRSSLACGTPGGAPHALAKVGCIPGNRPGTWCGRRWFRYGWRGPSVVRLSVHPPNSLIFFHGP